MIKASFRADIQGLRAIAILSVVMFHASADLLPGGFVGVDIFFVISGYLITGIILREMTSGSFSIANFYRRRVRRIFPALYAVLAVSLTAGYILLAPGDYRELALTTLSSVLFVSNTTFHLISGYFNGAATLKPLLHTWSLSVEEQFYLLYPIVLWLAVRQRLPLSWVLVAGGLASLAMAEGLLFINRPIVAFFESPPRAFELLIGALCATMAAGTGMSQYRRDILSAAGLALIVLSIALIDSEMRFPGMSAAVPCVGTALIIVSGRQAPSAAGRLISSRPFLFFGEISYSLYLWHWPILVFGRHLVGRELLWTEIAVAVLLSFILGQLSFRFIERPFLVRERLPALRLGAVAMGSATLLGGIVYLTDGLPARFPPEAQRLFAATKDFNPERARCHSGDATLPYERNCAFGDRSKEPDMAVWGDSHGAELVVALGNRLASQGRSVLQITASACPPVPGYVPAARPTCARHNQETLDKLSEDRRIATVIMVANYDGFTGDRIDGFIGAAHQLKAAGKRVVIVYPIPIYEADPPTLLANAVIKGEDPQSIGLPRERYLRDYEVVLNRFAGLEKAGEFEFLRSDTVYCGSGLCKMYDPSIGSLYFNARHLGVRGASLLADRIVLER